MAQLGGNDLLRGIGGSLIGKMPMSTQDALFDAPGTARIVLQHFHVVVRFEHEGVCRLDALDYKARSITEISKKSNPRTINSNKKPHRIIGVMRHAKRIYNYIANFETGPCAKDPTVELHFELGFDGLLC